MTHQFLKDLKVGDRVEGFYLVKSKRSRTARNQRLYLDLDLADRSGQINAKVWDGAEEVAEIFGRGDVIKVRGVVEEYGGNRQLKIERLRPAREEDGVDTALLIKSSPYLPEALWAEIQHATAEVKEENLRRLLTSFWEDAEFTTAFSRAPAARNLHHAYVGGLLEHTVKVLKLARFAAEELYPGEVDRDLLLAGALLHDIGKVEELDPAAREGRTTAGYLVGHVVMGAHLLREKAHKLPDFPPELLWELEHILLSHHGELEWGAPITPQTPEALIIHFADNLDAKTQIALTAIAEDPNLEEEFTEYHKSLARHFYKSLWRKKTKAERGPESEE